jgi:hypothetical protein
VSTRVRSHAMPSIPVAKFNRLSISFHDWDKAHTYLQEARKIGPGSWAYDALIEMAIICYWRPFSPNERIKHPKATRNLTLDDLRPSKLTRKELQLHQICGKFRNKAIAHSEYRFNPTRLNVNTGVIESRRFSITRLPDSATFPERLEKLCEKLIELVHGLRGAYTTERRSAARRTAEKKASAN